MREPEMVYMSNDFTFSLPGITRAGSKGMISARNIKAPPIMVNI